MRILKLCRTENYGNNNYYVMFDEIPKMTYEKIGRDYIGSATTKEGDIIFSEHLGYESGSYCHAFGGRELELCMKDGTTEKIKNNWYDWGSYKPHGEFMSIGAKTLEDLQDCYVYCGYNINVDTFHKMLDDYYSREKEYEYYEIEKWCKLQYKWYDVVIDGFKYPFMVNGKGDFVHRYSKEPIYTRHNKTVGRFKWSGKTDKYFDLCLFELKYKDGDKLVKVERRMIDVLKESLPFDEEYIKLKCKIK